MIRVATGYKALVNEGKWGWRSGLISPTGMLYVSNTMMGHSKLLRVIAKDKYEDHPLYSPVFAAILDGWTRLASDEFTGTLEVEVFSPYYQDIRKDISVSEIFVKHFRDVRFDIVREDANSKAGFSIKQVTMQLGLDESFDDGFSLLNPYRRRRR